MLKIDINSASTPVFSALKFCFRVLYLLELNQRVTTDFVLPHISKRRAPQPKVIIIFKQHIVLIIVIFGPLRRGHILDQSAPRLNVLKQPIWKGRWRQVELERVRVYDFGVGLRLWKGKRAVLSVYWMLVYRLLDLVHINRDLFDFRQERVGRLVLREVWRVWMLSLDI